MQFLGRFFERSYSDTFPRALLLCNMYKTAISVGSGFENKKKASISLLCSGNLYRRIWVRAVMSKTDAFLPMKFNIVMYMCRLLKRAEVKGFLFWESTISRLFFFRNPGQLPGRFAFY